MRIPLRAYTRLLYQYLRPQWPQFLALALLLCGGIGLQLWSPQIIRSFLDRAAQGLNSAPLLPLALLYIAVALGQQACVAVARYIGQGVSWRATNQLRLDLTAHCLRLEMAFHKAHTPGELIERIDGDVNSLTNFFSQFFIDVVSNVVLLLGVLVLLFREDWRIGVGLSAFAVFALVVLFYVRGLGVRHWVGVRQVTAQLMGFLGEVLSATPDIRTAGAADYVRQRFFAYHRELLPARQRALINAGMVWSASIVVFAVGNAVAFGLGATLWARHIITLGTVYLIWNYSELLRRPMEQIRVQLQDLQQAGAAISRIDGLLARRPAIVDGPGAQLPSGPLTVAFEEVSFAYEPGEPVLQGLNLRLAPGEIVGLLGRTGSGKSSIARLLLRLHDPSTGAIRLGGVDARGARLGDLRRRVGLVTQDVQLLQASVRDNLTFFDPAIPDARMIQVLADLSLTEWLAGLPAGLDTVLESGAASLSAGEAQLLAMARIFLADPGLVILDEASSRLDPATEHRLEQAVTRLLQGRTAIIIAHRLATVQRADTIVVLESGRILEAGPRAALAVNPTSRFYQLLQTGQEELLA